ncbi:MAG: GIY-YIG nuclease family protein [Alphaproteobacteria bacterium]
MTKKSDALWFVYLLECTNGRLYTGITTDLAARFRKHSSGKGAMFTRLNRPARMIAAKQCANRSEASKLEWVIKSLKPQQKRATASAWQPIKDLPRHKDAEIKG